MILLHFEQWADIFGVRAYIHTQTSKLKEGKVSLMILDDLVLDVTRYLDDHPGGRFLIEYCIGRDISKFYYGGYALDNNDIKGKSKRHAHSNISHL